MNVRSCARSARCRLRACTLPARSVLPLSERRCSVLVVGAGPTGLTLALWLRRLGVSVRIIDKESRAGTTSRAFAVQARTLELHDQIGLAHEAVARGVKVDALNMWTGGRHAARIPLADVGEGLG